MIEALKKFVREENGATSIEYALIAAGISIIILTAAQNIGTTLNSTFTSVKNAV